MTLEVLVATMHQKDFSKLEEMNIQSDVIFANQADRVSCEEMEYNGHKATMITTKTRGVGLNRNIALMAADADILLFADDDVRYYDGYEGEIIKAFEMLPQADVIIFELDYEKDGAIILQYRHKSGRLPVWRSLRHGAARIAVRRSSVEKANLWFHTQFGGGCKYSSGEDGLYLLDCYRKRLKLCTYAYCIGATRKDTSTWFQGYNEKYFYDKGAWLACAFPKLKHLLKWYFVWRFRNMTERTAVECLYLMNQGMLGYARLEGYSNTAAYKKEDRNGE